METQITLCAASWTLAIYLFAARVAESERARKTRGGYLENRIPRRDGTSGDTIYKVSAVMYFSRTVV